MRYFFSYLKCFFIFLCQPALTEAEELKEFKSIIVHLSHYLCNLSKSFLAISRKLFKILASGDWLSPKVVNVYYEPPFLPSPVFTTSPIFTPGCTKVQQVGHKDNIMKSSLFMGAM